jgi:superkiller protein 3
MMMLPILIILTLLLPWPQQQLDEAALRSAVMRDARDADARYRLGLVLFKQRKLDESIRLLEQAARIEPEQVLVWRAVALVHGARHDGLGEARALQKIIELDPAGAAAYRKLATLLLEHRTADAALAVAQAGSARFPTDAELLRLRGLAQYGLGRKPEAIDSFLSAIDAAPESEVMLASIETLIPEAAGADRLPAIQDRLRRFAQAKPTSPLGPFLLALAAAHGSEEKESHLRKALAADASFWPAHYELGRLLRDRGGDASAAIESFNATLELNPLHEGAHFALSLLYAEAGDREKARTHRQTHHRLRAQAAEAEQKRNAAAPRLEVTVR